MSWPLWIILFAIGVFIYALRAKRLWQPTVYNPPQFAPWFGSFLSVMKHMDRFHDWKVEQMKQALELGREMTCTSMFAMPVYLEVGSARNVQFMLKDEFDNFIKGPEFQSSFLEILGHGIFNSDGEQWRVQRKVASHMFSSRQLNEYMFEVFHNHAELVSERLSRLGEFDVIDMQDLFYRYTLESICRIAFGININCLDATATKQPPFAVAFDSAQEVAAHRWFSPPIIYKIKRALNLGCEADFKVYIKQINDFVFDVVKQRRAHLHEYENSGDLLSLFLNDAKAKGEELTDENLRDIILNFLIAGRDTTASALTYMFKSLSDFPDIETKVCDELHSVLGEHGTIDENNIKALHYLEGVFLETVRLNAPVAGDLKKCIKECTFPCGTVVPAGSLVGYSPYALARLSNFWGADAEEFKVERWLDEDTGNVLHPSAFKYPNFNAGPRLCLGKTMATIEAKVLAATLLQKYSFRLVPGHDTSYKLTVVLSMKHGLKMTVKPRRNEL